jgi:RND family efflux transporter MFP subunit
VSQPAQAPDLSRLRIEREPAGPPRTRRRWLLVLLAILLLALAGGAWLLRGRLPLGPPRVAVARATRTGGAAAVSGVAANGYVVARRQAALSTDIQGRLVELRVEEGDRVAEGDVIARLDTRELEAARVRVAADLQSARAEAEWARLDFERKQPLLGSGDVSGSEVDRARIERDRTSSQVASLESALAEIEVQVAKSSVYAPFAGVITAKNAEVGEVVSSLSAGANAVGSVATLVDFETLEVQVELAQTSLRAAREGAPVLIYLDAFPDDAFRGRVRQIWPTADRPKATVELRAEVLERDGRILPEMGVRVIFTGDEGAQPPEPRVQAPERAVRRDADGPAAFVLEQGRVRRVALELGGAERGTVQVLSGLQGGETLVLDPPASLADGDEVRVEEGGT